MSPRPRSPRWSNLPIAALAATALLGALASCGPSASTSDLMSCDDAGNCGLDCRVEADCARHDVYKHCDQKILRCVACLQDDHCAAGQLCSDQHQCYPGCKQAGPCARPDGMGVCEVQSGRCVDCLANGDCTDPKLPACDATKLTCVACTEKSGCAPQTYCATDRTPPVCLPGCLADDDCQRNLDGGVNGDGGTPPASPTHCNLNSHQCVECLDDTHCALGQVCRSGRCGDGCNAQHGCRQGWSCCNGQCNDTSNDRLNCGGCGVDCGPRNCCDSACSDALSDVQNCGACGMACVVDHGAPSCIDGACAVQLCNPPFENCNGLYKDGCETDTSTNINNCGRCMNVCNFPNSLPACQGGVCKIGTCVQPWANCDGKDQNGCEVQTDKDVANCGGCGRACSSNNVTMPTCQAGLCVSPCSAGFADCNGDKLADGCEVRTENDVLNCGRCGNACSKVNAVPTCSGGQCQLACAMLTDDCDKDVRTGCETSLRTLSDCGRCGASCLLPNANPTCSTGLCQIATCAAGWSDCNKMDADGCEVHTAVDAMNCGACGNACSAVNGAPSCAGGQCFIRCNAGFADCNTSAADGCEINTNTDTANCGACGFACRLAHVKTNTCAMGACGVGACEAGWADCNGVAADGCEVNVNLDPVNCGMCGFKCSSANGTPACAAGVCRVTCTGGFADCDNNVANGCEINVTNDAAHCGACANAACSNNHVPSPTCFGSLCNGACAAGFADCNNDKLTDGCETAVGADVKNCGACGRACSSANGTAVCTNGACVVTCKPGWDDCDKDPANGCETPLNTLTSCGACNTRCSPANAVGNCASGTCQVASCGAGYGDCNANPADGCEVNLLNDAARCGACTNAACSANHVTPACINGACAGACAAGFADCNNDKLTDGCETAVGTDVNNCGACGRACSSANGTAACMNGNCTIACKAGWADCNGSVADGCETSLNSLASCGGCGVACAPANAAGNCGTGTCKIASCNAGYADCNGSAGDGCEVAVQTDANNCGACGAKCSANHIGTPVCAGSVCLGACDPGYSDCNGNKLADGCETATGTDVNNCGACGKLCSRANGTPACANGQCSITCGGAFRDCDGDVTNGCEVNTAANPNNCGACGAVCSGAGVIVATCSNGACTSQCATGYTDCNAKLSDGCEVATGSDPGNCGGCGKVCSTNHVPTAACSNGVCTGACATGYADCNNNKLTDGCEILVGGSDANNCGGCGVVCAAPKACANGVCM